MIMDTIQLNKYIEKAIKIHGNKYDYSKSNAHSCKDKAIFICPIHGEFKQTWDNHVNGGSGCPKCAKCHKYTNEEWIEEASKKHNGKYDYSKTNYVKARDKVIVICHEKDEFGEEHGEFEIRAGNHIAGIGCPKCAKKYRPTTDEWIRKARKVHGDKYLYDKVSYNGSDKKVLITCPIHGDFWQEAASHLSGVGCPKCRGGVEMTTEEYIDRLKQVHGNRYDYSKVNYINAKEKIDIICSRHGVFRQLPYQHLQGQGCPKCKSSKLENILMKLFEKNNIQYTYQYRLKNDNIMYCDFFLNEHNIVVECQGEQHFVPTSFGNNKTEEFCKKNYENILNHDKLKYETCMAKGINVVYFTIPKYFNSNNVILDTDFYKDKLLITDTQKLLEYLDSVQILETNDSFFDFFKDLKKDVDRNIINVNGAIRYKDYMVLYIPLVPNKRGELNDRRRQYIKRGYKVIIVFEDEYLNHKDIVLSKIRHLFKMDEQPKIMARKCNIRTIERNEAKNFLIKNHIQGFVNSSVYLGAYNNDTLIAVMSFTRERGNEWTLTRFASDNHYVCCGIGGKLFKYFIRNNDFNVIKSFADKRWTYNTEKNLYLELGFSEEKNMPPEYRYFKNGEIIRHHKFNFRKQVLHRKYGLSMALTETEMVKKLGYDRIWDCGLIKYIYVKQVKNNRSNG